MYFSDGSVYICRMHVNAVINGLVSEHSGVTSRQIHVYRVYT